ncbi:hypothetical protein LTR08_008084 [Meristemomyces frigidus]|nr:hypothetical protein LTR08_008084 [Meristemomyces frigidus]
MDGYPKSNCYQNTVLGCVVCSSTYLINTKSSAVMRRKAIEKVFCTTTGLTHQQLTQKSCQCFRKSSGPKLPGRQPRTKLQQKTLIRDVEHYNPQSSFVLEPQ